MSFLVQSRPSESPLVESITHGYTVADGSTIRPAEICWHMVLTRFAGEATFLLVGPLTNSAHLQFESGAEILWIKFKLGAYMPHLPTRKLINAETPLPEAAGQSFWLKGSAWKFPTFENVDAFVQRLIRADVLVYDPVISRALCGELKAETISDRTLRHRFLQSTGMAQGQIMQFERAQRAVELLHQGKSILDTVYEAGYFDQPHLTRSLKHFIGYTPAQIARINHP